MQLDSDKQINTKDEQNHQRKARLALKRREFIYETIGKVYANTEFTKGLKTLALTLLEKLPHTFCRVLVVDDDENIFTVKVAELNPLFNSHISWEPKLYSQINLKDWPELRDILNEGKSQIIKFTDHGQKNHLEKYSKFMRKSLTPKLNQ